MTSKRFLIGWLAALALVAAACGGGGEAADPLASAGVPVVPESATERDPTVDEEADDAVVEEELTAEATVAEVAPETFTYESDEVRAASMVLQPSDLDHVLPGLEFEGTSTGPISHFAELRRAWFEGLHEGSALLESGRLAGYEAMLVAPWDLEVPHEIGTGTALMAEPPHPSVYGTQTRVTLYPQDESAAGRVVEAWTGWRLLEELSPDTVTVTDQAGLPGAAFTATVDLGEGTARLTHVAFSRKGAVGEAVVWGGDGPEVAVDVARALAVRIYRVQNGLVPARDPYPEVAGFQLPHEHLERFEASSDVILSDGGEVTARLRSEGIYGGEDNWSCQLTFYENGTETLVNEIVVEEDSAYVLDVATGTTGQYPLLSFEAVAATEFCPAMPDTWRTLIVFDRDVLIEEQAATAAGAGTSYRAEEEWQFVAAFRLRFAEGTSLRRFVAYVAEDGWLTAMHTLSDVTASAAREFYGVSVAGSTLEVQESLRVFNPDGEDVVVPEPFAGAGIMAEFEVGAGAFDF